MAINWFPGHMTRGVDDARKALAAHDAVVEILDARCPAASANPLIATLRSERQRPCLKVLNKTDLADPAVTKAWIAHFNAQPNVQAIAISCKKPGDANKIIAAAQRLAPQRNDTTKPLRLLVMGVPNVGKSTLINALLKRRTAAVGDEPAVTKSQARYILSPTVILTDTPGLMWPKIEREADGLMLAASHLIGANAYIETEVAAFLGDVLLARYPQTLATRYGAKGPDGVAVIEAVAAKRGFRLKGGAVDFDKAAITLLTDYRSGALGRISLETPETRQAAGAG